MMKEMNGLVTEEELELVIGGKRKHSDEDDMGTRLNAYCHHCQITGKNMTRHLYKKNGRVYCPDCGTEYPELA